MNKIYASVILPTYNESGNIIKLIETIQNNLSKARINHEIIVVDDDSPDKTGLLAQKYFSHSSEVRVIIRKKERGLATAIRAGIEKAVGEVIVLMDTDFNHDPELCSRLVQKCEKYDVVVGSRFIKGGGMANKSREILSRLFNLLIRIILSSPVHDHLSGHAAVKQQALEKINMDKVFFGYGDYFIRLLYFIRLNGGAMAEVPSFYNDREYGSSKSQFLNMFKDYLTSTIKLRMSKV